MRLCSVTNGRTPAHIQEWKYGTNNYGPLLFHPMVSFNTPSEHQETSGFFVFRGLRKIPVALHGLMLLNPSSVWGGIVQKRFSNLFALPSKNKRLWGTKSFTSTLILYFSLRFTDRFNGWVQWKISQEIPFFLKSFLKPDSL